MKPDLQLCGTNKGFDEKLSFGKPKDDSLYNIFLYANNDAFIYLVGKRIDDIDMLVVSKETDISKRTKQTDQKNLSDLISQLEMKWHQLQ